MALIICEDDDYVEAAEFYAKKLHIPDDTIIAIGLYNGLDVAGYCIKRDREVFPYFIIALDIAVNEDQEPPLSILAHEMVHVKQYVKGELIDHGKYCKWHGKKYQESEINSEEYFFSPWEVEAYGMQVGLYHFYLRSLEE